MLYLSETFLHPFQQSTANHFIRLVCNSENELSINHPLSKRCSSDLKHPTAEYQFESLTELLSIKENSNTVVGGYAIKQYMVVLNIVHWKYLCCNSDYGDLTILFVRLWRLIARTSLESTLIQLNSGTELHVSHKSQTLAGLLRNQIRVKNPLIIINIQFSSLFVIIWAM